jgi:hypothetical protein
MRKLGILLLTFGSFIASGAGCTLSLFSTPVVQPTPIVLVLPSMTPLPASSVSASSTPVPFTSNITTSVAPTARPTLAYPVAPAPSVAPASFCADAQATALINSFKNALQTANGDLLASLVSPMHGMEVRYYRTGRVVSYDPTHAKFLFESTFSVDWGLAPASGLATKGSFHEVILPVLLNLFGKNYTLACNQIQVGGTTYKATWPYTGINFYSAYYPGTQPNGSLDWLTWIFGMQYDNGKPYLYAIMHFEWEP